MKPIRVPKNSATGFVLAFLMAGFGFGMVWHIWWMGAAAFLGILLAVYWFTWDENDERTLSADEVRAIDEAEGPHLA